MASGVREDGEWTAPPWGVDGASTDMNKPTFYLNQSIVYHTLDE